MKHETITKNFADWDQDELREAMMRDKAATGKCLPGDLMKYARCGSAGREGARIMRERILEEIKKSGPVSRDDLVNAIPGLTTSNSANHLSSMRALGMITHPDGQPRKWIAK